MIRRPPRSTRTDTLFPYTTLFRTSAGFRRELASRCVVAGGTRLPVAVVTGPGTVPVAFADGVHHVLPEAAAAWVDKLYLRSILHLPGAEPVVPDLLPYPPQPTRAIAHRGTYRQPRGPITN